MSIDFQDFLRQKTAGSDVRERRQNRSEWLNAVSCLHGQIHEWLLSADPEELLEFDGYLVKRAEWQLGIYDAPATKIRLGTDEVDVVPIGRYSIGFLPAAALKAFHEMTGTRDPAAGRVDITSGERTYILLRDVSRDPHRWYAIDERRQVNLFDQSRLEAILQDLWS